MSNTFTGVGNLGAAPSIRYVDVAAEGGGKKEKRPVCDLRLYVDRRVPDGKGGFVDRGGFWLTASLWGPRAEKAAALLSKGARVTVSGTLYVHAWTDKENGEERSELRLDADDVSLNLLRVEAVQFAPARGASNDILDNVGQEP